MFYLPGIRHLMFCVSFKNIFLICAYRDLAVFSDLHDQDYEVILDQDHEVILDQDHEVILDQDHPNKSDHKDQEHAHFC